jgi:hypothetical protein
MKKHKKHPDRIDSYKQGRLFRQAQADRLANRLPGVQSIQIKFRFTDFDGGEDPAPKSITFCRHSKAFFEVECPFWECVMGGFDLTGSVFECIRRRQTHLTGESTCGGWQDRERINNHRCLLKAHYDITVEYAQSS